MFYGCTAVFVLDLMGRFLMTWLIYDKTISKMFKIDESSSLADTDTKASSICEGYCYVTEIALWKGDI